MGGLALCYESDLARLVHVYRTTHDKPHFTTRSFLDYETTHDKVHYNIYIYNTFIYIYIYTHTPFYT